MKQPSQPLAEIFGYLVNDYTEKAERYRNHRLRPFNNKVPNCTKDKAKNPLGVCSIYYENQPVITCPIRFREDWIITDDAASFFFEDGTTWSSLTEVRLNDSTGKSAGNIDVVLVAYHDDGKVYDFGALEMRLSQSQLKVQWLPLFGILGDLLFHSNSFFLLRFLQ